MKHPGFWRSLTIACLLLTVLFSLVSCHNEEDDTPDAVYYTVTFDANGGSEIAPKTVPSGTLLPDPGAPEREGYVFSGWIHNGVKWDFSTRKVRENMTLTAKWHSAETIFSYEVVEATQTAKITKLKEKLEEIEVPDVIAGFPVTEIGDGVFADLYSNYVEKIYIPASVTTIGAEAFRDSAGIELLFDESCQLTAIGEDAFSGCTGLRSIPLGEGLEEIAAWSFSGCTALEEIRIPESVTVIRENAFGGCTALTTVMMYAEVDSVEDGAFEDCDALETIYFYGSAEQIDTLLEENTANMNDALQEAAICLYSETEPSADGAYDFWYWDENEKVKLW